MVGFVNVYKPKGITSNYVLTKIKKTFNIKKVGHMGTLDPLASGVLPVAIGKATKMFNYFQDYTKTYVAEITFGYETTTLDSEGEIVKKDNKIITFNEFKNVLDSFPKSYDQMPPNFSAKKINGTKAYKLARQNIDFELKPKKVNIYGFSNLKQIENNVFEFMVSCSSGTYIRSLVKDIANVLNTCATMTNLERVATGVFNKYNSVNLEDLLKENNLENNIISLENIFNFPKYHFSDEYKKFLDNGVIFDSPNEINNNAPYFAYCCNKLYGVYENVNNKVILKTYLKDEI